MTYHVSGADGAAARVRRWRRQPWPGRRRREARRKPHADGAGDPRRRHLSFDAFVTAYDELVDKARNNTLGADDLTGANITLTNPGGIGTAASVPRLMNGQGTIVATGAIGYPPGLEAIGAQIGAEHTMTMTSTYDHRVIQGAESGRFLALIESLLHGEEAFYEDAFAALDVAIGPTPEAPRPATLPRPPPSDDGQPASEQTLQAVQVATTYVGRVRSHGHLAARLDPLGSEPEGDPGLDPEALGLTAAMQSRLPARLFQMYVPGRHAGAGAAAPA